MGIEYYVVCRDRGDAFELGKGAWYLLKPPEEWQAMGRYDFIRHFQDCWNGGTVEPWLDEYIVNVGSALWAWCVDRNFEIDLSTDDYEDIDEFQVSGTRYKEKR